MAYLDQNNLEKALGIVFDKLQKNNLLEPGLNKDSFIQSVASKIMGNDNKIQLNLDDFNDQKKLSMALITESLSSKFPGFKPNLKLLFTKHSDLTKEEKEELKEDLKNFFTLINKPKNAAEAERLAKFFDELAADLTRDPKAGEERQDNHELTTEVMLEAFLRSMYLRSMHGGDDPRIEGEIDYVIQGPIIGNLIGGAAQSPQLSGDDISEAADESTYNANNPNYTGRETAAFAYFVAQGGPEDKSLNDEFRSENLHSDPLKLKPHA